MACLTALTGAEATVLASEYGLRLVRVEPLEAGSVNSNFRFHCEEGAVFARIYEEQGIEGAAAELKMLAELAQQGVPVTPPLPRRDGQPVGVAHGKPFSMYPWVAGEWLCHQRLTLAHCESLGRALAGVHLATRSLSALPEGRFGLPQLRERLAFINATAPQFADAATFVEQGLERYCREAETQLPRGLIHGDLFRDNVLWRTDRGGGPPEVAALLDFESASAGVFTYDLMVCVLSWCFTGSLDLARVHALLDGYESVRLLDEAERRSTTTEGMAVCLRFATTRITDFAMRTPPGATPKRDFRRFFERYEVLRSGAMQSVWRERGSDLKVKG